MKHQRMNPHVHCFPAIVLERNLEHWLELFVLLLVLAFKEIKTDWLQICTFEDPTGRITHWHPLEGIWIYQSPTVMLPYGARKVDQSNRSPVPEGYGKDRLKEGSLYELTLCGSFQGLPSENLVMQSFGANNTLGSIAIYRYLLDTKSAQIIVAMFTP
ncbi:hypothetical protein Nepgr_030426 [Nepenthes gracilis]|uniref:Uncharacterized protein n=1 Tax=Nepenthes gracilis TaxID=150966 RepID=A0AAD3TGG3_NEPGR|nr:hypothetical protein Nepgr_030426 [Nepenthes gracilis]